MAGAALSSFRKQSARGDIHNAGMAMVHQVDSVVHTPLLLVSTDQYAASPDRPWAISEADIVTGVPLPELIARLGPGEHIYFVDFRPPSGRVLLTRLV